MQQWEPYVPGIIIQQSQIWRAILPRASSHFPSSSSPSRQVQLNRQHSLPGPTKSEEKWRKHLQTLYQQDPNCRKMVWTCQCCFCANPWCDPPKWYYCRIDRNMRSKGATWKSEYTSHRGALCSVHRIMCERCQTKQTYCCFLKVRFLCDVPCSVLRRRWSEGCEQGNGNNLKGKHSSPRWAPARSGMGVWSYWLSSCKREVGY